MLTQLLLEMEILIMLVVAVQTPERRSRSRPGSLVLTSESPVVLTQKERSRTTEYPRIIPSAVSQAAALKSKGGCFVCITFVRCGRSELNLLLPCEGSYYYYYDQTNIIKVRVRTDTIKVWKVMEFKVEICQVWKIMENNLRHGKVWKSHGKCDC